MNRFTMSNSQMFRHGFWTNQTMLLLLLFFVVLRNISNKTTNSMDGEKLIRMDFVCCPYIYWRKKYDIYNSQFSGFSTSQRYWEILPNLLPPIRFGTIDNRRRWSVEMLLCGLCDTIIPDEQIQWFVLDFIGKIKLCGKTNQFNQIVYGFAHSTYGLLWYGCWFESFPWICECGWVDIVRVYPFSFQFQTRESWNGSVFQDVPDKCLGNSTKYILTPRKILHFGFLCIMEIKIPFFSSSSSGEFRKLTWTFKKCIEIRSMLSNFKICESIESHQYSQYMQYVYIL